MTDSERKDDDANFRVPIPPTRSYTVPLATLSQPEENVREESRRILEKLLQRDLHKRRGENGGEGSKVRKRVLDLNEIEAIRSSVSAR